MSELELVEASQLALNNAIASFAIFFTMVGAYLTAAYVVGKSLTRTQMAIVNCIFIISMLGMTYAIFAFSSIGFEYYERVKAMNPSSNFQPTSIIKYMNLLIDLAMIGGCLVFMRGVRS